VLAAHCSATESPAVATPVPVTGTVTVAFDALLFIVMAPVMLPAAFGKNSTTTMAVCPEVSVVLLLTPVALKPVPVMLAVEMVRLEFPPFVTETCCVADPFTFTFPKLTLDGFTFRIRELLPPVPLSTIVVVLSDAVEATTTEPLKLPVDSGRNPTVICVLAPVPRVMGLVKPETENPVPFGVTLLIVRLCPPVFVSWIICVFSVPTATVPNCAVKEFALR
jgi:hypothetical protein